MDLVRDLLKRGPFDYIDHDDAKWRWRTFRKFKGLSDVAVPLLTAPDGNAKMDKTQKFGVYIYGLALAASDLSGLNVCRYATPLCRKGCLQYAGHNNMEHAQAAQRVKTLFLQADPRAFITLLVHEIAKAQAKHDLTLRIRLNVLSDIPWEQVHPELFERFPTVAFYDYTKWPHGSRVVPSNYNLTYSASERMSDKQVYLLTEAGEKVAVVFATTRTHDLPTSYKGMTVVDGDAHDDRWLNPQGTIIGLRAKGPMRDGTYDGFVRGVA